MKIVGIIALIIGMTMGSTAFARDHDSGEGTQGIGTVCWTDWDRGGAVEVCGTTFKSVVVEAEGRGE